MSYKFKLNKEDKELFRKMIDEALDKYHQVDRIVLSKEELNDLLFDTVVDKDNVKYKRFGFFSKNLSKLDLSQVTLYNVSLNNNFYRDNGSTYLPLTGTNLKIDLTKTYEYRNKKEIIVDNIDFTGLDLSKINFKTVSKYGICFRRCGLANTNINLNVPDIENVSFTSCDLRFNQLESITFTYNSRGNENESNEKVKISSCILTNTGIKIILNTPLTNLEKENFVSGFKRGSYDHCYVNGHYILNYNEMREKALSARKEYDEYYKSKVDNIVKKITLKMESTTDENEE